MKKVFAMALVLALALGLVLTGCGGGGNSGGTSTPAADGSTSTPATDGGDSTEPSGGGEGESTGYEAKDEIVIASSYIVANIDPQNGAGMWEWSINRGVYDSFFRAPKMDYYNCEPWLCESYEYSDDQMSATLNLRQGVKFHDGSEFTADDAIFSLERAQKSAFTAPAMTWIDSVEKVDDYTITINMKYTFPIMVEILADYQFGAVVSKNAVETYGVGSQEAVVGTGPYKLVEWTADNNIVLEYFEDHWAGQEPEIKKVTYRAITDYSTAAIAMRSGEIDVLPYGLTADFVQFAEDPNFTTNTFLRDHTVSLSINNQKAPYDDVKVRQAIYHAIDKESINAIVFEGTGNTNNVLVRTSPRGEGYQKALADDRLVEYTYDVEKAKALLAEVGIDDSNPLTAHYVSPSSTLAQSFAAAVQAQLAMVNINLDVEVVEASEYINRVATGEFELTYGDNGFMTYFAPVLYNFQYHSGAIYNRDYMSIPEVDEILEKGLAELDSEVREDLYADMLTILTEQAVSVPVVQTRAYIISTKGLQVYPDPVMLPSAVYDMHWGEHDPDAITLRS